MNTTPKHDKEPEMPQDLPALAEDLAGILEDMVQSCVEYAGKDKEEAIRKAIRIAWSPGESSFDMAEQMLEQALSSASETRPIRSGHVFCYACKSAKCGHSAASSPGEVFMGYRNNGEPLWQEFFNALNAVEDSRVGSIFGEHAKPLARLVTRKTLIANQLVGSGRNSMTYRVICQVIAGYFEVSGNRCALTLQVVENPQRDLYLQLLAPSSVREVMAEGQSDSRTLGRLYAAVRDLRHSLQDLQASWRGAKGKKERQQARAKIERLMLHQVHVIERKGRQGQRRTKHAHERSQDNRPVHAAMKDLEVAGDDAFFHDLPRKSIVVLGRRSRAHVFSSGGKHITTMQLPHEKLDRRVQRKRYAPMELEEIRAFRRVLNSNM